MNTLELIEVFTNNIVDVIFNFKNDYQEFDGQELEDYLNENFNYTWLDSTDEWVVAFGDEIIVDGLLNERQAMDTFYFLENLAYCKYYKLMNEQSKEL